jgi:GT2 family glycosyltransferase
MKYAICDLDIEALPMRLPGAEGVSGFAVVFRDRGRIVGFRLTEPGDLDADGGCDPARLITPRMREAAAIERLRDMLRPATPTAAPTFTAAICSKDRWDWVDRLLTSLEQARREADFEVLVVENAPSDDRMREVCARRGWVRYVREPRVGLDFARNRAIREATGDVVAFLDDDVVVDPMWIRGLRRAWSENPDAGCVTGLVLPMALDTEAQILFERTGGFRRGCYPVRHAPTKRGDPLHPCGAGKFGAGANMSLRRSLVLRLGGFDEALDTGRPLPGGGDLDIFYRVLRSGAMLVYEPQMAVFHEHRREMAALARQYYTWGLGMMAFVVKSMRADPSMRWRHLRLVAWWFRRQAVRLARSLVGREALPPGMILGEIRGGVVGLMGEYGRSQARSEKIRREVEAMEREPA